VAAPARYRRQFLALVVTGVVFAGTWPAIAAAADPVIAAAGDIACSPSDGDFNSGNGTSTRCRQKYTSNLLVNAGLAKVLTLGDNQYQSGSLSNFQGSYDPSWGRVKSITRPSAGNHEPPPSTGYYDYFNGVGVSNGPAGERGKGYYSFDVGSWHLIALNSNCESGGCEAGSAQEQWLRSDLAANPRTCTLAYWHHPRFSSGHDGNNLFMQAIWQDLYNAGVDVALVGHSHDYERFAPQDASGNLSPTRGIREFVVGTGGAFWTGLSTAKPNSEVRQNTTFGVLELTLHPTSYGWQFVPEAGKTFSDSGSQACSGAGSPPADSQPPSAPTNLTATASSSTRVDLRWASSTDNVGVTGYEIYRGGALLATTSGTSYTDNGVSAASTYNYQVKARDAAGNRSAFSNSATVTTPGSSLVFPAQADVRVEEANPGSNYGTSNLRADGGSGSDVESYLRFAVSGVSGTIEAARLRVYAYTNTADGPAVYSTVNGWSETGISWSNRPPRTSNATDDKGAIATGTWVEYDVRPFVAGNGTYDFVIATSSSDGVDFRSREYSDGSRRPELVLSVSSAGGGDTQAPTAPSNLSATASSPTQVRLSWSAASDNVAVSGYEIFRNASLLTTTTGTSYTDSAVSPGSIYTYQVRAFDAAGNRSAFSNPAIVTTPTTAGTTLTFSAAADARVAEATPTTNYGSSYLRADGGGDPDVQSYLTFNVSGVLGFVQAAKLRVFAYSGTANGPTVQTTTSAWLESGIGGITWGTRPPPTSAAVDDKGVIAAGSWVEYDVTPAVAGNGSYSFVLTTGSSDGVDIHSREAAGLRPELVLTVG
jgi:chitodextrinase